MGRVARRMGITRGSVDGRSRVLGLQFPHGEAKPISADSDAAVYGVTTFPSRVVAPDDNVLKTGDNQRKLGKVVTKGKWKGFPIYSLKLEERATCPRSCRMWLSCYGNHMGHAKRYAHGPALETQIWRELAELQVRHPRGFVVRLHILGDFYSVSYVDLWQAALDHFPALHVFGYTARNGDPIGKAVEALRDARWDRFAVRTSGAHTGPRTTVVQRPERNPAHIICPAQFPAKDGRRCSNCALCWQTKKPIAFLSH